MTKIEKAIFGSKGYQAPKSQSIVFKKVKPHQKKKLPKTMTAKELKKYNYENMSEEEHQEELVKWLSKKKIYFEIGLEGIFLPNPHEKHTRAFQIQLASNRRVLAKMRLSGMKKGVSDLKIYLESVNLHIELKRVIGGIISSEQKETHELINKKHYCIHEFCYGVEDAKEFILKHF